jgi:hypothetical protein
VTGYTVLFFIGPLQDVNIAIARAKGIDLFIIVQIIDKVFIKNS